jgi:Ca2+-binding EF-hand superfamily protein
MIEEIGEQTFTFDSSLYIIFRYSHEADSEGKLVDSFRVSDKDGTGQLQIELIRRIFRNLKQEFTEDQIN